jgi:hypothetical protein
MLLSMGAWDVTAFGNDDAADWAAELVEADKPVDFLRRTFALAEGDGYLEKLPMVASLLPQQLLSRLRYPDRCRRAFRKTLAGGCMGKRIP